VETASVATHWDQAHVQVFKTQRDTYLSMRDNLQPGELCITGDFGVHQVQSALAGDGKLPDLVLVLHFIGEDGVLVHCYLDCLPLLDQHESKDWNYVSSTFDELLQSGFFAPFHKIFWWSDTGPNHFRTSNTMHYWRSFQEKSSIMLHIFFFAPYHGHSMCDGHIGAISSSITFHGNELNGSLVTWNRAWVEGLIAELSFTSVVKVPIVRTEKVVETIAGITKYLVFSFDPDQPGTVSCARMCGDKSPVVCHFVLVSPEQDNVASEVSSHQVRTFE